jgi:hypothetical protein
MKRPPAYSDSFIIRTPPSPNLEPLWADFKSSLQEAREQEEKEAKEAKEKEKVFLCDRIVIFIIKGSLHILFISSFETLFYFLYISQSENQGIMSTINTYYTPLINSCNGWKNMTKDIIGELLNLEVNKTQTDIDGSYAFQQRSQFNNGLLHLSIGYSVGCFIILILMCTIVYLKNIKIEWKKLLIEHLMFVFVLAGYEYFFYITIIYKYTTISTAEINKYIVDGLYGCV